MKKRIVYLFASVMAVMTLVSCEFDDSEILQRLEQLEGTALNSINQQLASIESSIDQLQAVDNSINSTLDELRLTDIGMSAIIDTLQKHSGSIEEQIVKLQSEDSRLQSEDSRLLAFIQALQEKDTELLAADATLSDLIGILQATDAALTSADVAILDSIAKINGRLTEQQIGILDAVLTSQQGDAALQQSITDLRAYADSCRQADLEWISATYSTIEMQDSILRIIASIDVSIQSLRQSFSDSLAQQTSQLSSAIAQSVASVQSWVNEALSGYYDIATADAKLAALERRMTIADSVSSSGIAALQADLAQARTDLTTAYTSAIASAIETNNGTINSAIAREIAAVNTRIDNEVSAINLQIAALSGRIDALEEALRNLQEQLSKTLNIVFSDNDVSCSPGDVVQIGYTIFNGTDEAAVYTLGENGWHGSVQKLTDSTGTISVTAPSPVVNGSVLVFLNDKDKSVIKALNFIAGSMTVSSEVLMADSEGDTLSVDVDTDLQYTVKIQEDADWIHDAGVATRSAIRHETVSFIVDEYFGTTTRSATVQLVNASGLVLKQLTVRQSGSVMPANEIWYTSTDGNIVETSASFGATLISNTYGKKGVITFDGPISRVGYRAFYFSPNLKTISLPEGVTTIDTESFYNCNNFVRVEFPEGLESIGVYAFAYCEELSMEEFPESLIIIDSYAFAGCLSIKDLIWNDSLQSIGSGCFRGTEIEHFTLPQTLTEIPSYGFSNIEIQELTIPASVHNILNNAFSDCEYLKEVIIPNSVISLSNRVFYNCPTLEKVYLGCGLSSIGRESFASCTSLKEVHTKSYPFVISESVFDNLYLSELTLYVPKDTKKYYEQVEVWRDFGSIVEVDTLELNQPEAVDLGLSVKWASFNVWAQAPEGYGGSFAWGETAIKSDYSWSNYKYCDGGNSSAITKYCGADGKPVLEPEDDAATALLGNDWRMPTNNEFSELIYNCTWTWTTQNGANGFIVRSNIEGYTDRYIFIPCQTGTYGAEYWSSSADYQPFAKYLSFDQSSRNMNGSHRYSGYAVRPVWNGFVEATNLSLSETELELMDGTSHNLVATIVPASAAKSLTWCSDNTSVATVDQSGHVVAVAPGTCTITATCGGHTANCAVTILFPQYVDLGLSVKWAACNVGATNSEEYGDYFAWGETEPYYYSLSPMIWKDSKSAGYDWTSYFDNPLGNGSTFNKYNLTSERTLLDLEDDAASVKWGSGWRMPTKAEFVELNNLDNCKWTWSVINGVGGFVVQSKKAGYTDNSIFLPAGGYLRGVDVILAGSCGYYWASTFNLSNSATARVCYFTSDQHNGGSYVPDRNQGCLIRAVHP